MHFIFIICICRITFNPKFIFWRALIIQIQRLFWALQLMNRTPDFCDVSLVYISLVYSANILANKLRQNFFFICLYITYFFPVIYFCQKIHWGLIFKWISAWNFEMCQVRWPSFLTLCGVRATEIAFSYKIAPFSSYSLSHFLFLIH